MKKLNTALKLVSVLFMCSACVAVHSQGVDMVRRSYQEAPDLPIAPTNGAGAMSIGGARVWDVATTDGTIRKVIEKWALASGWVFGLEQWNVDRDLPVVARNSFQGDFRGAVRNLLSSTELTDMPLQPCFYNNSVLRIVPRSEVCDRMAAADR